MTFKSHTGIGLTHSLAVVDNLDAGTTGLHGNDVNLFGASIHGILHQLLDDGSGPLYDFASCNLVGDGIGEKVDDVHIGNGRYL